MSKQCIEDRLKRLAIGCCPVHGLPMTQTGNIEQRGEHLYVVGCPRKDCDVQATEPDPSGPATLLPRHAWLVQPPAEVVSLAVRRVRP